MYLLVKILTHFTIWLTCKRFTIFNKVVTEIETPLVLGCHHPNSFLDAILIGAQMKKRVHFLTRSDVFKNKWAIAVMRSVNMIPIYRIRDGKENLVNNDVTFNLCREIIKRGEHVLIFVEGFCQHQTTLQTPLKKGAPRLLIQGWKDGVEVQLQPVWIRFNSFKHFPKEVDISFGTAFGKEIINATDEEGLKMQSINKETERQLLQLSTVVSEPIKNKFRLLLAVPALLGFITHVSLFLPVHFFAKSIKETIHYDSVLFSAIALLYPIYLLLVGSIVLFTAGWQWALLVVLLLPLLVRSYTLWKYS
jgi:1-acyl-sn-glycerol-3-phosphate acyltransferase